MMNREEIVLAGFGGQGIILAGYIVGQAAAIHDRKNATFTQDYGPEARGSACRAQVVISDVPVSYPFVENPSVMLVMSQEAYTRYTPSLDKDALLVVDNSMVKTEESGEKKIFAIPATAMAKEIGSANVANIIMLGFLTAISSIVSADAARKSMLTSVPKGTEERNLKAFEQGYRYGLSQPGQKD
ncbi:MAG: 2-oxoacid:acceptor oxidoreductase family protein [Chloroflexota bacterium]